MYGWQENYYDRHFRAAIDIGCNWNGSGDFFIIGKIDKYRATGMDALVIKVDASGNALEQDGWWRREPAWVLRGADHGWWACTCRFWKKCGLWRSLKAWLMKVGNDSISSDNITQEVTIDNTGEEKSNMSMPITKRTKSKAIPSFELSISLFSIGILFILKGCISWERQE